MGKQDTIKRNGIRIVINAAAGELPEWFQICPWGSVKSTTRHYLVNEVSEKAIPHQIAAIPSRKRTRPFAS